MHATGMILLHVILEFLLPILIGSNLKKNVFFLAVFGTVTIKNIVILVTIYVSLQIRLHTLVWYY